MVPQFSATPLDSRRIRAALAGHAIGNEVQLHEELASTSDHVREQGFAGHPHGLVVFAESQTAGRGRRENRWSAEPRQDLLFSILLRPVVGIEKFSRLATLAALGLSRGVEGARDPEAVLAGASRPCSGKDETPLLQSQPARVRQVFSPQIKWPNDLLLGGKKFCGILAEMFASPSGPFLVLGAGMNVNGVTFPPELRGSATSLRLESGGQALDRTGLAIALLRGLEQALQFWDTGFESVITEIKQRSFLLGKRIHARIGDVSVEGMAHDLGREGGLVLRRDDGSLLELTSAENARLA